MEVMRISNSSAVELLEAIYGLRAATLTTDQYMTFNTDIIDADRQTALMRWLEEFAEYVSKAAEHFDFKHNIAWKQRLMLRKLHYGDVPNNDDTDVWFVSALVTVW